MLPRFEDLPGRFVKKGELMAHVVNADTLTVRTIVSQQDIDLVRTRTRGVDVRLADDIGTARGATLKRDRARRRANSCPARRSARRAAARCRWIPRDKEGRKAAQKYFHARRRDARIGTAS